MNSYKHTIHGCRAVAELSIHWFCPECDTGLVHMMDISLSGDLLIEKPHDDGQKSCFVFRFRIAWNLPTVAVEAITEQSLSSEKWERYIAEWTGQTPEGSNE